LQQERIYNMSCIKKGLFVVLLSGILLSLFSVIAKADDCKTWKWHEHPGFTMKTCEYSSGGSGYTSISHNYKKDITICWTLTFADGRTSKGCHNHFDGEESSSSCFRCAKKNSGGVTKIALTKFKEH